MIKSDNVKDIFEALIAAQKNMGKAKKDSKNPFFKSKYADLNSVLDAALPALHEQGIAVTQTPVTVEGRNYVRTMLIHKSGQFFGGDTEILLAKSNDPQAQGSGISYARRYGLQALLGMGAEDDDAESVVRPSSAAKSTTTSSEAVSVSATKTSSFKKPAVAAKTTPVESADEGWS